MEGDKNRSQSTCQPQVMWRALLLGGTLWGVVAAVAIESTVLPDGPLALVVLSSVLLGGILTAMTGAGLLLWRGASRPPPSLALLPEERLLASAPVRHVQGGLVRGGVLFVSSTRLCFVPHRFNFDSRPSSFPLATITGCRARGEHALHLALQEGQTTFRLQDAPLVALWLSDVLCGDRSMSAVVDIGLFAPEPAERRHLVSGS